MGTCAHFRKGGEATGDLKMGSGDEVQARGVIPHRRGARWLAGCYWGGMGTARAACVAWARAVVASVSVSDVLRTLSTHTLRNASYTCCVLHLHFCAADCDRAMLFWFLVFYAVSDEYKGGQLLHFAFLIFNLILLNENETGRVC